ncbi:hypothetical protein HHI36_011381, partial [Cryptolaemus montrouzieri]
ISIIKRYRYDPESFHYFAQDGNGGIWILDCNVYVTPEKGKKLIECHAGEVMDLAAAPSNNFFATLGSGGKFLVYNYLTKQIIFDHTFPAKGSCMLWLEVALVRSGDELIMGFDDGNLRVCLLDLTEPKDIYLDVIQ